MRVAAKRLANSRARSAIIRFFAKHRGHPNTFKKTVGIYLSKKALSHSNLYEAFAAGYLAIHTELLKLGERSMSRFLQPNLIDVFSHRPKCRTRRNCWRCSKVGYLRKPVEKDANIYTLLETDDRGQRTAGLQGYSAGSQRHDQRRKSKRRSTRQRQLQGDHRGEIQRGGFGG